jgi:hypothetical protein
LDRPSTCRGMPTLPSLATEIAADLGPPFTAREDYAYTLPTPDGAELRRVTGAVFSSPSPSLNTAFLAISEHDGHPEDQLTELGYFGAPFAFLQSDGHLHAYRYSAPLIAEEVGRFEAQEARGWIRANLTDYEIGPTQLSLLAESRDLILTETTRALSEVVSRLMRDLKSRVRVNNLTAFELALQSVRSRVFGNGTATSQDDVPHDAALSFSHIPLEAVAELYETLALDADAKRRLGVVYTPAWIAKYLIRRLPSRSFRAGPAVDPTCGSGTFLVSYLERFVTERARWARDPLTPADLEGAIKGMDLDSVALESTRLTLDLFAHRLGMQPISWQLRQADATIETEPTSTLIGNLPFGYRS